MGGRGSSSGGAGIGGGGGADIDIISTTDLISQRETKETEVDEVLTTLRRVYGDYDYAVDDIVVAKLGGKDGNTTMAYCERGAGVIGVNEKYFDVDKMNSAYAGCVSAGFHPSSGNRTGMEATIAHELGHALNGVAAGKMGLDLDKSAEKIIGEAFKARNSAQAKNIAGRISGYAKTSDAECVAEAFCDVYCNGGNAKQESRTIVDILKRYL